MALQGASLLENSSKSEVQVAAEREVARFRDHLGPFVVAAETSRIAMIFTSSKDPENPIVFANDSFLALTGYERDEVLGQSFGALMERGAAPEVLTALAAAFESPSASGVDIRYRRKDGGVFWADIFMSPVRDQDGETVQYFISFMDLTKHRLEQDRSKMMIDELNHRVKNTLSTVQSIVTETLRTPSSFETIKDAIVSRIFALSLSHDLLSANNWEGIGLHDLLDVALEPFGVANGRKERFLVAGDNMDVPPKVTLALGIAFNELATNAVKYGAFSDENGSIAVTWRVERDSGDDRLVIHWTESGGPPVRQPTRKGFGSQVLLRGLVHELEGVVTLDYHPTGVACIISFPAPGAS